MKINKNSFELNEKLSVTIDSSDNEIKFKYKIQNYPIMFAHELIHVLRIIFNCNDVNEEEDTIYGLSSILEVDGILITENAFRRDLGMSLRISHESRELYIFGNDNKLKLTKNMCKKFMEK